MGLPIAATKTEHAAAPSPWVLPNRSLTVFYGCPEIQRLSHYFLPRILLRQKRVLYLDGANQISPLLIARFARERALEPSALNALIRVARAFTCFQLTELIRRVPKVLATFHADVLIVTALPDLFFDEDVQDRPARASFEHALKGLRDLAPLSLSIAVFSDATSFKTKRRDFFQKLRNQADHIVKVEPGPESSLSFTREKVRGLECRRHDTPPLLGRMQYEVLAILAEAHDYDSYLQKLEVARGIFASYQARLVNGEVVIRDLVVSKRITREPRDYQKASVTAITAQQLFGSGVRLRPGQNIEYVITDAQAHVPNDRVRAYALWEGWFGYDRNKYAAMLREAFEPFVVCVPKRAEPVLLDNSISEEELKRFPLFAALALVRP